MTNINSQNTDEYCKEIPTPITYRVCSHWSKTKQNKKLKSYEARSVHSPNSHQACYLYILNLWFEKRGRAFMVVKSTVHLSLHFSCPVYQQSVIYCNKVLFIAIKMAGCRLPFPCSEAINPFFRLKWFIRWYNFCNPEHSPWNLAWDKYSC